MHTFPRILFVILALSAGFQGLGFSQAKSVSDSKHLSRLMRNRDGSVTEFRRDPTNLVLEKLTYVDKRNGERVLSSRSIFRRHRKYGYLVSGIVEDGHGTKLFRIIYGYHKDTGRLVAENMYDARVRRTFKDAPTKEEPVRATRYHYTAQGERSAPIVFTSQAGKTSEQLMQYLNRNKPGSDVDRDPFRNDPVNPNARPLAQ